MTDDSDKLAALRQQIDALDVQIIELLAKRIQYVRQAGEYKQGHALPALDENRWQQATAARLEQARQLGLPEELIGQIYELIHSYTLQVERDLGAK